MLSAAAAICALGVVPPPEWVEREKTANLLYTMDTSFTSNWKAMPSVGNGYVGTQVTNPAEYVAGVYNWNATAQSARGTFPATTNIGISGEAPAGYALDMQHGTAMRVYGSGVVQRWYAHRTQKHLLITEFDTTQQNLTFTDGAGSRPANCKVATSDEAGTCYLIYHEDERSTAGMKVYTGQIDQVEYPGSPLIKFAVVRTAIDSPVRVNGGKTLRFLSVRTTSLGSQDVVGDAVRMYNAAVGDDSLWATHAAAWEQLSSAGIFVEGDHDLAQSTNASFYVLVSSLRADEAWSTSPGGLQTNGYWGNVFWDSDTWIYPNMVLFQHELGLSQARYRYNVRHGAALNAKMQRAAGYQFPWQSGETGQEVCYNSIYEYEELHISGDVAQAQWQMYRSTHDKQWLADYGFDILFNVSTFWASRVAANADGTYSINNVMCPDEDANGVNNSAYTNAVAKQTFAWTAKAASILGKTDMIPAQWAKIAEKIVVPFDEQQQYHPEYDGYNGGMVKQADVVLMGYPLMYPMPDSVLYNDLTFYGSHTRMSVAMTWAIFAIGYQKIGHLDQAAQAFNKTVRANNPSGPFHTWGEYEQNSGCPNFQTAAGGFLQSMWAGFGGVRLTDDALVVSKPAPPSGGATRMTLSKVYYRGCLLDVDVVRRSFSITLLSCTSGNVLYANGRQLVQGAPAVFQASQTVNVTGDA